MTKCPPEATNRAASRKNATGSEKPTRASPKPPTPPEITRARTTTRPVTAAGRLFAIHHGKAFCLDGADLAPVWTHPERSLKGHASLVASEDRVLALTGGGELVLLDARADGFAPLARQRLFEREVSLFAHPALAGDCIYVRGPRTLLCVALAGDGSPAAD